MYITNGKHKIGNDGQMNGGRCRPNEKEGETGIRMHPMREQTLTHRHDSLREGMHQSSSERIEERLQCPFRLTETQRQEPTLIEIAVDRHKFQDAWVRQLCFFTLVAVRVFTHNHKHLHMHTRTHTHTSHTHTIHIRTYIYNYI